MFDVDVEVSGPFKRQPLLVKLGIVLVFLAFQVLLNIIPVSLLVLVIVSPDPAHPLLSPGGLSVLSILLGMMGIGFWCHRAMVDELAARPLSLRRHLAIFAAISFFSLVLALAAALLSLTAKGILAAIGAIAACLTLGTALIAAGQSLARVFNKR